MFVCIEINVGMFDIPIIIHFSWLRFIYCINLIYLCFHVSRSGRMLCHLYVIFYCSVSYVCHVVKVFLLEEVSQYITYRPDFRSVNNPLIALQWCPV